MIVNIRFSKKIHPWIQSFKLVSGIVHDIFSIEQRRKSYQDSIKLKSFFKSGYPSLVKDHFENFLCVSCDLCQKICPTNAIKIEKAKMVNFPNSLMTGETPKHFYLDTIKCTQCGQCSDVCILNAIDTKAFYEDDNVDLVTESQSAK